MTNRPKNRIDRSPSGASLRPVDERGILDHEHRPGCTPWMIIAASSTAQGAEPEWQRQRRDDAAGHRRVVARLSGH